MMGSLLCEGRRGERGASESCDRGTEQLLLAICYVGADGELVGDCLGFAPQSKFERLSERGVGPEERVLSSADSKLQTAQCAGGRVRALQRGSSGTGGATVLQDAAGGGATFPSCAGGAGLGDRGPFQVVPGERPPSLRAAPASDGGVRRIGGCAGLAGGGLRLRVSWVGGGGSFGRGSVTGGAILGEGVLGVCGAGADSVRGTWTCRGGRKMPAGREPARGTQRSTCLWCQYAGSSRSEDRRVEAAHSRTVCWYSGPLKAAFCEPPGAWIGRLAHSRRPSRRFQAPAGLTARLVTWARGRAEGQDLRVGRAGVCGGPAVGAPWHKAGAIAWIREEGAEPEMGEGGGGRQACGRS
ncbi:hypothetical protein WMY93_033542 [Mugilogobius chulae]|uniref:Uncharacterized protein n=1 Tax=Mugilogobius chulae TaxID=88201 RepID=A0AAW0MHW4_9GOBI